ncbi:MAG: hypothetical protein M3539_18080 [Acidobacteriota bacterium]|nr:hypothetical protein [Acidobacteriota bacterium]
MKNAIGKSAAIKPVAILAVVLSFLAFPLLTGANAPSHTVTIVNNSSREIRHVYFSTANSDNWGPDQLNNVVIAPGGTHSLNSNCSASETKVIAEDQDGCFYYQVVSCSENSGWTINSNSARDCG